MLLSMYQIHYGQNPEPGNPVNEIIEEMVEDIEDENAIEEIVDELYNLYNNPVNINGDYIKELVNLNLISENQFQKLLDYRSKNRILSIYELQFIDGFDIKTMKRILPFIKLTESTDYRKVKIGDLINRGRCNLFLKSQMVFEKMDGYKLDTVSPNSGFIGSAPKLYLRTEYKFYDRISFGFTGEKDEGERFGFRDNNNGFDFNSFYIQIKGKGYLKQVLIGDFKASFGQGLVLNTGFKTGMSFSNNSSFEKSSSGIQKYSSSDETSFLRGAGIIVGNKKLTSCIFISSKKIDANIVFADSLESQISGFSSIIKGGLHNTYQSLEKRKTLSENVFGVNIEYKLKKMLFGLSYSGVKFNMNKIGNEQPNEVFNNNSINSNFGINYRIRFNATSFFGEGAIDSNRVPAFVSGLSTSISDKVNLNILGRYYPAGYFAYKGSAVGVRTSNNNEIGVFSSIDMKVARYVYVSAFYDYYRIPWLSYNLNIPSYKNNWALKINYLSGMYNQIYFIIKYSKSIDKNSLIDSGMDKPVEDTGLNIRLHYDYSVGGDFHFRSRIEYKQIHNNNLISDGWLIYQDIIYTSEIRPFSVTIRYAMFDTDDWDSRIYSWEHDVLYSYSSPALHLEGIRSYLLFSWDVNNNIKVWARISRTMYSDVKSIGSGLNMIDGNHKTDFRIMIRYKF